MSLALLLLIVLSYVVYSRVTSVMSRRAELNRVVDEVILEDQENKRLQHELDVAGTVGYVKGSQEEFIRYTGDGVVVVDHPLVDIVCKRNSDGGWVCYSTTWVYTSEMRLDLSVFDNSTENYFVHREAADTGNNLQSAVSRLGFELADRPDRVPMEKIFFNEHELLWRSKRKEYEQLFHDWTYSKISKFSSNPTIRSDVWYYRDESGRDVPYSVSARELEKWLLQNKFNNGDWQNERPFNVSYYKDKEDFFVFMLYCKIDEARKSGKAIKIDTDYKKSIWDVEV